MNKLILTISLLATFLVAGTTAVNCVYGYSTWLANSVEVANSSEPAFVPLTLGVVLTAERRPTLGVVEGAVTITTAADIVEAMHGWDLATPMRTLAGVLAVTWFNLLRGAIPTEPVVDALAIANAAVQGCYNLTMAEWTAVLGGATTCGEIAPLGIASAMITLFMFNEGLTSIPKCTLADFPYYVPPI